MTNRWVILAVLFLARMAMAVQFQSVAALSPLMTETHGLALADIGLLIGLYLAPGVFVAIPGGAVAARFGDKRVVALGMVAMIAGGAVMALASGQSGLIAGRLLAGTGGVVLNVVMTKMLIDWFSGREISTAMAVFVASWPVGIAAALLALPWVAQIGGLAVAVWSVTGLIAVCLMLFALLYRGRDGVNNSPARVALARLPVLPLALAALVWSLYNTALALVFSFAPLVLIAKGWTLAHAGSATSLFMIVFSLALPLGGWLADVTGRRDAIIALSLLSFAILMPVVLVAAPWAVIVLLAVVGALFALAAGPTMTLPATVLPPEARSFGMGVFLTIYYAVMMIGPVVAGGLADRTGHAGVVVLAGAALCVASLVALGLFRHAIQPRSPDAASR